jgi:GT2 family glycosyltransferase
LQREVRDRVHGVVQARAWKHMISRAKRTGPVYFPVHHEPRVSIIIPVYNNVTLTATCLNAVLRHLSSIPCEIIVVDDASTDGTADYLDRCSGVRVIRHVQNHGFVDSVNDGAAAARGRYVYFLNNDTIVTKGWLEPLLSALERNPNIGAAGSQLRAPDGRISEAGGLIWRDGSGMNYGRGKLAAQPSYRYARDVDYCSGASLMVRADLFRELGGFSPAFRPAYYEDADLCFRMRERGFRVRYQPESVVIHFEGATHGRDERSGGKRFQAVHREIFAMKWRDLLAQHYEPAPWNIEAAARRLQGSRTVLFIDSFIPFDDRSAGGRRAFEIMRLMHDLGCHVIFIADDGGEYEPYCSRVRAAGIEVIPHRGDAIDAIRRLQVQIDVAWISRPDLLQRYARVIEQTTQAKIVYDTVDLHFVRLQREMAVTGNETHWQAMRELELRMARTATHTVVTTEDERRLLHDEGVRASVVPIVQAPAMSPATFAQRRDVLFLGNYTHEPNVDAALWLAQEIMPYVWEQLPDVRLVLAGADPNTQIEKLASERISVTGYVPDVAHLFDSARVFAAPLRFGAGMKGKIVQSLAHALPVVTTATGAEGIGLTHERNALIREDARPLADAIVRLYTDADLWNALARNSHETAQRFAPLTVRAAVQAVLDQALLQEVEIRVDGRHPAHAS